MADRRARPDSARSWFGGRSAPTGATGTRTAANRTGGTRTAPVASTPRGLSPAATRRGGVSRTSGSRHGTRGRGGVAPSSARIGGSRSGAATFGPRAGVRYSSGRYRHYGHRSYPYRSYYHRHHNHWYFGYVNPWHSGHYISYWDPWYYGAYSSFWRGGVPAFGFGVVYYEPVYDPYFVVQQQPVYVEQPAVVVEAPAPAVPAVDEEAIDDAPGRADFAAGLEAFLARDYAEARRRFLASAAADDQNGEAWMALAHATFALGEYAESAVAIATAAQLGGFPRGYRFDPRPIYPVEGSFDAAVASLAQHRATYPQDADAHLVAAYLGVALGDRTMANQAILQVLQLHPADTTAPLLSIALLPPLPPEEAPAELSAE